MHFWHKIHYLIILQKEALRSERVKENILLKIISSSKLVKFILVNSQGVILVVIFHNKQKHDSSCKKNTSKQWIMTSFMSLITCLFIIFISFIYLVILVILYCNEVSTMNISLLRYSSKILYFNILKLFGPYWAKG